MVQKKTVNTLYGKIAQNKGAIYGLKRKLKTLRTEEDKKMVENEISNHEALIKESWAIIKSYGIIVPKKEGIKSCMDKFKNRPEYEDDEDRILEENIRRIEEQNRQVNMQKISRPVIREKHKNTEMTFDVKNYKRTSTKTDDKVIKSIEKVLFDDSIKKETQETKNTNEYIVKKNMIICSNKKTAFVCVPDDSKYFVTFEDDIGDINKLWETDINSEDTYFVDILTRYKYDYVMIDDNVYHVDKDILEIGSRKMCIENIDATIKKGKTKDNKMRYYIQLE